MFSLVFSQSSLFSRIGRKTRRWIFAHRFSSSFDRFSKRKQETFMPFSRENRSQLEFSIIKT